MNPAMALGACGFSLIAVCYGFARFAFGLFLPQIDSELALSASLSGLIAGGSFLGYCIAILLSAYLTERRGPRFVATAAALVAAVGMVGIATAATPVWLAVAVMLAGSSTGLASPPMASAVAATVRVSRQGVTNTVINAGTGAGVVMTGPVALLLGEQWRWAFAGFAIVAFALAAAVALSVPGVVKSEQPTGAGLPKLTGALKRLIAASFLMGAASTALWSFGGQLVTLRLSGEGVDVGTLWIAIGAAGLTGAFAGTWVARFGLDAVHRFFLALLAASIVMVGMPGTTSAWTLGGGLLFGAAYITLTGVYLIWGVAALSDRPAVGLMVGFLTIAVGQTLGAPLFGLLMDHVSATCAIVVFALLALAPGVARAGRVNALSEAAR